MRKKVLIYYPPNKRAIALNAVVDLLQNANVDIFVLTQEPAGLLHEDLTAKFKATDRVFHSNVAVENGLQFYYQHIRYLVKFCRKYNIDVVLSHLQSGNLVGVIASWFMPNVKFIAFRHHFQYFKKFKLDYLKSNRNELIGEKIVNIFAGKIVVPSTTVRNGMIEYEKVDSQKVALVPYIYNFAEYPHIDQEHVAELRRTNNCHLLLLMSSRFIEPKRHALVVKAVARLINEYKQDIRLLLLDEGPLKGEIQSMVVALGIGDRVSFVGYTNSIMDYMAAADLLIHPSLSEASNSSVKEMGLAERTAIVCSGVGDFDDYIDHKENGFLIDPLNSEDGLLEALEYAYGNKESLYRMGLALKEKVIEKFSPNDKILAMYEQLIDG